jgi:hypothetical protein
LRKRSVLIARGTKVLPTLSFLSIFSLDQIHLFLKKDWGKEGSLLQAVEKYCLLCLFFPYFPLTQSTFFSKKMDVAQTHFGAALYRLCVMLCTIGACNST